MTPRDEGYGAVGAEAVAALGNLDVGVVGGCGEQAPRVGIDTAGGKGLGSLRGRTEVVEELGVVELAVELVYLGDALFQLLLVAL